MKYRSFAFAIALVAAANSSGGNLPVVDTSVRPGDAFYQYVNGAWLKATEIPADRSSMSDSAMLSEQADRRTREIIQETAQDRNATADAKKIADFYNAFMDEATIEKLGLEPLAAAAARDRGDSRIARRCRACSAASCAPTSMCSTTRISTPTSCSVCGWRRISMTRAATRRSCCRAGSACRTATITSMIRPRRRRFAPSTRRISPRCSALAGITDADAKAGAHFRAGKAHGDGAQHARRIRSTW